MAYGHQLDWAESRYDARYRNFDGSLDVIPTERVGAPMPNRFKARIRRMLFCALLCGAGWAVATSETGTETVIQAARALSDMIVASAHEIAARVEKAPEPSVDPSQSTAALDTNLPEPGTQATFHETTTEVPPAVGGESPAGALGASYTETSEPAEDDKDNAPQRKVAIAAGLSPDLPNVLLSRLSKSDLKNAAYAIRTALEKTADDGSFKWPTAPSRGEALFEVRFVEGAGEGCRRYIVTVIKDRWSSTSAALERCGNSKPDAG